MSESKHTSGPWECSVEKLDARGWKIPAQWITIYNNDVIIAHYDTRAMEYPDDDVNAANARLIAAAPTLLVLSHNLAETMGIDYAIKKLSTLSDDTMALGAATILAGIQWQAKAVIAEVEKEE